jgi:hexosaminidase
MSLTLLPAPRQIYLEDGLYPIADIGLVRCGSRDRKSLLDTAKYLLSRLKNRFGLDWGLAEIGDQDGPQGDICLQLSPKKVPQEQGYYLVIGPGGIQINGHDEAGVFYGVCTLIQIMDQAGGKLPCLQIQDWPDFPVRGVMLDISRDKVPTMGTLFSLVELLASWKINQLQLYMEHTFAYPGHEQVWRDSSPMTGAEVQELDAFCLERHIELVPNQNSFGHMQRWLVHPRYAQLAEVMHGYDAPWGQEKGPFSLCAVDPGSLAFLNSLYDDLLPHFSSNKVNVGLDETFDLGQGRSKGKCEQMGRGQVYLDFLLQVYASIQQRKKTMMYWSDILLEYPELISSLPKDAIALEWGYETDHPFAGQCSRYQAAGIPFYVCPGTSSWSSIAGRSDNALGNLLQAAENGIKYGAGGYLITDWGDNGHWQPLPVSYFGFAAGAAFAWSLETNREIDMLQCLDLHAFHDRAGHMGKVAYDLGNIYQAAEIEWKNASVLFSILQRPMELLRAHPKIQRVNYEKVYDSIDRAVMPLSSTDLDLSIDPGLKPELYSVEFELAARLLRHACLRGMLAANGSNPGGNGRINGGVGDHQDSRLSLPELFQDLQEIITLYEDVWLLRNRAGGLADSAGRLKLVLKDYEGPSLG